MKKLKNWLIGGFLLVMNGALGGVTVKAAIIWAVVNFFKAGFLSQS